MSPLRQSLALAPTGASSFKCCHVQLTNYLAITSGIPPKSTQIHLIIMMLFNSYYYIFFFEKKP